MFPSIKISLSSLNVRSYAHDSAPVEYVVFVPKENSSINAKRKVQNDHLAITCYYIFRMRWPSEGTTGRTLL